MIGFPIFSGIILTLSIWLILSRCLKRKLTDNGKSKLVCRRAVRKCLCLFKKPKTPNNPEDLYNHDPNVLAGGHH